MRKEVALDSINVTLFDVADTFFDESTQNFCIDLEIEIGCGLRGV